MAQEKMSITVLQFPTFDRIANRMMIPESRYASSVLIIEKLGDNTEVLTPRSISENDIGKFSDSHIPGIPKLGWTSVDVNSGALVPVGPVSDTFSAFRASTFNTGQYGNTFWPVYEEMDEQDEVIGKYIIFETEDLIASSIVQYREEGRGTAAGFGYVAGQRYYLRKSKDDVPEAVLRSFEFFVNPESVSISTSKTESKNKTRGGFIYQYWGEEPYSISVSGKSGPVHFPRGDGIEGIVEDITQSQAYQALKILEQIYIDDHAHPLKDDNILTLSHRNMEYTGHFEDLKVEENVSDPLQFSLSFTFIALYMTSKHTGVGQLTVDNQRRTQRETIDKLSRYVQ